MLFNEMNLETMCFPKLYVFSQNSPIVSILPAADDAKPKAWITNDTDEKWMRNIDSFVAEKYKVLLIV